MNLLYLFLKKEKPYVSDGVADAWHTAKPHVAITSQPHLNLYISIYQMARINFFFFFSYKTETEIFKSTNHTSMTLELLQGNKPAAYVQKVEMLMPLLMCGWVVSSCNVGRLIRLLSNNRVLSSVWEYLFLSSIWECFEHFIFASVWIWVLIDGI